MSSVFVEPVSMRSVRAAIQRAAQRFPQGYAVLFKKARQRWLIYANERLKLTTLHCFEHSSCRTGIAIDATGAMINVCAWHSEQLLVFMWGNEYQAQFLLSQMNAKDGFEPVVFIAESVPSGVASLAKQLWPTACRGFPVPQNQKHKQPAVMLPIRRLNASGALLAVVIMTLICLLWYGYKHYSNRNVLHAPVETVPLLYQELSTSLAQPAALFRLDYQLQSALQEVPGWQLLQVDYSPSHLSYRIIQQQGLQSDIRRFADRHGLSINFHEGQVALAGSIQLPSVVTAPDTIDWHSITELTDWLDERLRMWLPTVSLSLGELTQEGSWQRQRMRILMSAGYNTDLLTLAGVLDGLPVALEAMNYRQQDGQIQGILSLVGYGREPK